MGDMGRLGSILLVLAFVAFGSPVWQREAAAGSETAGRPYGLVVPDDYDGEVPVPLVVLLHGYSSRGSTQASYFGIDTVAEEQGFLLAHPNGTRDPVGNRFWNATDACCDFFDSGVDDVAYLEAVIDEIAGQYRVDERRVYLAGHSNGAFMAHRLACDRAGRVAAIVTLAGMQWGDPARCPAGSPVSVLHVHGRKDKVVQYEGGATPKGRYPGAVTTAATWAAANGCDGSLAPTGERLDLVANLPGDDTAVERHSGCAGVDVELWTIEGGGHVPAFNERWAEAIWGFLAAHPKAVAGS